MSDIRNYQMYINGKFTQGYSSEMVGVENPADESLIAYVPAGSVEDANDALQAARNAQPDWAALTAIERGNMLQSLANSILAQTDHLANIVVKEQGKPFDQACGEIAATAMFIEYAAQQARRIKGELLPSDYPNEDVWIRRAPYGVVVGLTAWNYPSALAGRKLGPALAAGNTIVLKGHDITPLSGLEIARIADDLGFPDGVINVITGDGRNVGEALVKSPMTDMLSMTGSVRAGREISPPGQKTSRGCGLSWEGKRPLSLWKMLK